MEKCSRRDGSTVKIQTWSAYSLLKVAFAARLILVFYGRIHDYFFNVGFTDVDYHVVSDAGRLLAAGRSPFERATYRYTPLLALFMTPNIFFYDCGKIMFSIFDILVGWIGYRIAVSSCRRHNGSSEAYLSRCKIALALWLFSPITAIISTRGNADVMVCAAVLLSLYYLDKGKIVLSAMIYGCLAVQFKIYPVIYLPSIFLYLMKLPDCPTRCSWKVYIWAMFTNWRGFLYAFVAMASCGVLVSFFYSLYGWTYLDESFLYHFSRVDIRHNFSPYHLVMYLSYGEGEVSKRLLGILAFVPQWLVIVVFAFRYFSDLPFCWFISTIAFVALNKVCTSQYFIWYLCFIPVVHRSLKVTFGDCLCMACMWGTAQALWLCSAYFLEFQGINVHFAIWLFSLLMFASNVYIIRRLLYCHRLNESQLEKVD